MRRRLARDWRENHRFFGGAPRLLAHGFGTAAVALGWRRGPGPTESTEPASDVECVTFSVLPSLTARWADRFLASTPMSCPRLVIGDCSGGLYRWPGLSDDERVSIVPILNEHHGVKLDRFLSKVCRSRYVVINDDDIFWLDETPLRWALDQLRKDERTAVVSLFPRSRTSETMRGEVDHPMGSYCLVLDRETWLREKLSFQVASYDQARLRWRYDTADYAHLELVRRGYRVILAPDSVRESMIGFEGLSSWGLRIRSRHGDIRQKVGDDRHLQDKAFRVISTLQALHRLPSPPRFSAGALEAGWGFDAQALRTARAIVAEALDEPTRRAIETEVECKVAPLALPVPSIDDADEDPLR